MDLIRSFHAKLRSLAITLDSETARLQRALDGEESGEWSGRASGRSRLLRPTRPPQPARSAAFEKDLNTWKRTHLQKGYCLQWWGVLRKRYGMGRGTPIKMLDVCRSQSSEETSVTFSLFLCAPQVCCGCFHFYVRLHLLSSNNEIALLLCCEEKQSRLRM